MTGHQVGGKVQKNPLYTVLLNRENSKGKKSPISIQEIGQNADFPKVYQKYQQDKFFYLRQVRSQAVASKACTSTSYGPWDEKP